MTTGGPQAGVSWPADDSLRLLPVGQAADRAAERLRRFTDQAMAELIAVGRALEVIQAGLAGAEALRGVDARFRTIADTAADAGQTLLQEVAREAEMLIVVFRGRPKSFAAAQADVVQHVVDVLSLMLHDLRRRLEAKPPANVQGAAVTVRERMRHAMREIGHREALA